MPYVIRKVLKKKSILVTRGNWGKGNTRCNGIGTLHEEKQAPIMRHWGRGSNEGMGYVHLHGHNIQVNEYQQDD